MSPSTQENELGRISTRIRIPSRRKRSQGEISIQISSKAPKKQNIQVSRPIIRLVSKTASTRREPSIPPIRTSPNILGSDDIERDIDEGEDDNDIEEDNIEEEEEQLTFTSTWRATVGKEPLPGARTRIYKDGEITMNDLFSWEIEVMG